MKNHTHATEAEAEATFQVMREAFVSAKTIGEFRANLLARYEQEDEDPRGMRRMITVVEYDKDVFVLGGLTFNGTMTLMGLLESAVRATVQQAGLLDGPIAGEA